MEHLYSSRVNYAAAGLYAMTSPTVMLPGGGANVTISSSAAHGLVSGSVVVSGTTGVTGLNAVWRFKVVDADTIELIGSGALTGTPAGTTVVGLPDLDISSATFNKEWTVKGVIYGTGLVAIEDTVNDWSASERRFTIPAKSTPEGQAFSFSWKDFEGFDRFGTASAKLRVRLVSGTNVAVSLTVTTNG